MHILSTGSARSCKLGLLICYKIHVLLKCLQINLHFLLILRHLFTNSSLVKNAWHILRALKPVLWSSRFVCRGLDGSTESLVSSYFPSASNLLSYHLIPILYWSCL